MACKERMGPIDRHKPAARRILVLISDGQDNQSHVTKEVAASEALRAGAVIFTIDTDLSGMSYAGSRTLERLAEMTGGESFNQVGRKEVSKVFASIQQMIEGMYYLTDVPPDASNGGVHEVDVRHTGPRRNSTRRMPRNISGNSDRKLGSCCKIPLTLTVRTCRGEANRRRSEFDEC